MRLRSKLLLVNATAAVIAAVVFGFAYASNRRVQDEYLKIAGHNLPALAALQELQTTAASIVASGSELLLFSMPDAAGREALVAEEDELRERIATFTNAAARYVDLAEHYQEDERDTALDIDRRGQELISASRTLTVLVAEAGDAAGLLDLADLIPEEEP